MQIEKIKEKDKREYLVNLNRRTQYPQN